MLFLPILAIAIILYIIGQRIPSVILFFFFLFDGFQIVPDLLFDTFVGISKPIDFAFIYLIILFIFGLYRYDDFIPINRTSKLIAFYLSFIIISIGVSLFYYHIGFGDIFRTTRSYFFVLSYFVLRRLDQKEVNIILKILLIVVTFQSVLFAVQAVTTIPLLVNPSAGERVGFITRFYNSPLLLFYIVFYAIYNNPFQGWKKWVTLIIPSITIFLPLHRSLMMVFTLVLFIGYCLSLDNIKRFFKYIPLVILLLFPITFIGVKSLGMDRTVTDISNVMNGEFIDVISDSDFELDGESTLMFRMLHFFERSIDVVDTPMGVVFGAGFMAENSEYTNNRFNYQIGLTNDVTGDPVQIDSSDIAWSNFIIRYGVVGTLVFLIFYISFIVSSWGVRYEKLGLTLFLYLLLILLLSFTGDLMYQVRYMVMPIFLLDFVSNKNKLNILNSINHEKKG